MFEFELATSRVRRAVIGTLAVSGIISALLLALPLYMSQVFTRVLPSRSVETLVVLTVLVFIAFVAYAILDAVRQSVFTRAGAQYEALLAGPLVHAHFFDGSRDPSSGTELLNDIRTVRLFIASRAPAAIAEVPFMPFFLVIIFLVSFAMGVATTFGIAMMVAVAVFQQSALERVVEAGNAHDRASRRVLQSYLVEAETVRALGLSKTAILRWGAPAAQSLTTFMQLQAIANNYGAVAKVLRLFLQCGIIALGVLLAIEGSISPIVVFASMMISARLLAPLDALVGSWSSLTTALAAHRRIRDVCVGLVIEPERMALPEPKGALVADKLIYAVRGSDAPIIKRVSFGIPAGGSVGIIGPSGAGKSTLLKLLAGAISPVSGSVRLDGADIRTWNRHQLGAHTGYVAQSVEFFPGTVAENIARLDPSATSEAVLEAAELAGVHQMIVRFPNGYDTQLGQGEFRPSGGQKQLLALARAFYGRPKLLFLDEPDANLDADGSTVLISALQRAREWGATIVFVTQRPTLLQVVDQVLIMKDGVIEAFGPKEKVLPKAVKPVDQSRAPPSLAPISQPAPTTTQAR